MMCVVALANMPTNTMSSEASSSPSGAIPERDHNKEPNNNNNNSSGSEEGHDQRQNNSQNSANSEVSGVNNTVQSTSDDFGSTDEVKVFNDEDDRDGDASESYQAELQAEKSSLIHESEQVSSNQSYEIKSPPWTILWFRILGIFSVENIKRLCVFMFQT